MRLSTLAPLLLVIPVAALTILPPAPVCQLVVIPDYVNPIAYKAVLQLSAGCREGTVLRVRKSSTLNTREGGAKYQPIKPLQGAWEVGRTAVSRPVPGRELWTTQVPKPWRWEYWDGRTWRPARRL